MKTQAQIEEFEGQQTKDANKLEKGQKLKARNGNEVFLAVDGQRVKSQKSGQEFSTEAQTLRFSTELEAWQVFQNNLWTILDSDQGDGGEDEAVEGKPNRDDPDFKNHNWKYSLTLPNGTNLEIANWLRSKNALPPGVLEALSNATPVDVPPHSNVAVYQDDKNPIKYWLKLNLEGDYRPARVLAIGRAKE